MKDFKELEQIGIVGTYKENNVLYIITKDGMVWAYKPDVGQFMMYILL